VSLSDDRDAFKSTNPFPHAMMDHHPLRTLTYGMYIISVREGDQINGQLSNTVFQVASEPPMVSMSINHSNVTHGMITRTGQFCVSVLDITAPFSLISLFGFHHGGEIDKFASVPHRPGSNGAPIVTTNTNAFLEVRVTGSIETPTHTVFLGEVTKMDLMGDKEPMTYDHYRNVLKGRTPPNAPTFMHHEPM
jgi:ferric-chelate reductase [NAD(P)H]